MKPKPDRVKPLKASGSASKTGSSDAQASIKVPENAENFEHILRRIVIAKAKAKRQP